MKITRRSKGRKNAKRRLKPMRNYRSSVKRNFKRRYK